MSPECFVKIGDLPCEIALTGIHSANAKTPWDQNVAQAQNLENISFEKALGELEEIVRSLESGKAPLEESIGAYERGIALKTHCEKKLQEARLKIDKISLSPDGSVKTEPFDIKE